MRQYYVYILASKRNGTLYIGVTNNLDKRAAEHNIGKFDGFTKKYGVHRIVYYESTNSIESAIRREKQLKRWSRRWKTDLIEGANPTWKDLLDFELQILDPRVKPEDDTDTSG